MDYKELILQYADSLKTDLTWASKTHINMLTMLAAENKAAAASICATIERHILTAAPPAKLPTLYLLDSIIKNVKEPYISLFCRNLVQVFSDVWQQREVHTQLLKLLSMWEGIFPPQLLNVLKQRIQQTPPAQNMSQRQAGLNTSKQMDRRAVPRQQPASFGHGSLPSTSGSNGYYAGPQSAHTAAGTHQRPQPLQQNGPQYGPVPQAWPVPGQLLPRPLHAVQQQAPVQHLTQQSSSQPLVLPNLLSSLLSSGLLTVPPSVSIAPVGQLPAAPAVSYSQPSSRAGTPEAMNPDGLKFISSRLKEFNPTVLAGLMDETAQLRSKHLDMQFMRRRRQKNMVGASRQWFVTGDLWVAGTAAAAVGEGIPQPEPEEPQREAASVPVDDAQPRCALSGEKFEKFWHDEHQEWRYKNAVRVGAEDAARHGLQEGALVLESTLAGTPSSSQDAAAEHQQSPTPDAAESREREAAPSVTAEAAEMTDVGAAPSNKRSAEAQHAIPDDQQSLHLDKRIKLEV